MPWKATSPMDERVSFVVEIIKGAGPFSAVCARYGISRQTGYKWMQRYRDSGSLRGLNELSRRPHHSPQRTSEETEARVVTLRQKYAWGARKLQALLRQEGIELGVATINRILSRRGLVAPQDRHRPAPRRFCREAPNELWQMDFKGYLTIREGHCHPFSILDDHSRFLIELHPLLSTQAEPVHQRLLQAFEVYGLPDAILMDHGSPWWSTTNSLGLTWLSIALIKQDIRLHYSGIGHPQTQGKVERLHASLSWAMRHLSTPRSLQDCSDFFATFRADYNQVRPHESLDMDVPANRYQASSRAFNPNPSPWVYPQGVNVVSLNSQGMLPYEGTRYFVCESLANEQVGIQEFQHKVLVRYRHMLVREIDLITGRTVPLVQVVRDDVSTMS